MLKKFLMMAIVAVTASLASPSASQATFSLTLSGAGNVSVSDDTTGINQLATSGAVGDLLDADGNARAISVSEKIGTKFTFLNDLSTNFTYNGLTFSAVSANAFEGPGVVSRVTDFSTSVRNLSGSQKTVVITVTDDAFLLPNGAQLVLRANVALQGTPSGTFSITSKADAFPDAATVSTTITTKTSTFADVAFNRTANSFTLSNTITLVLENGASVDFSSSSEVFNATPVPSALILAAFGIPAFGLLRRRFATKVEATTAV